MAAGSDDRKAMEEIGVPNSARPSAGPGRMMMVGADDDDEKDLDGELLFDDEKMDLQSVSMGEVRQVIRQELERLAQERR